MVYVGIDLGGTNIKAAVVDDQCNILSEANRPTNLPRSAEEVCDDVIHTVQGALDTAELTMADIAGVGVGCPGTVDPATGFVYYSNNLDWKNFPMAEFFRKNAGYTPAMGNDANVAALGEACAGVAKGAQSAVVVTLGTGVGGGVILDGKILTGYSGAASELGHMVILDDGYPCTCGRKGCFESYSSATGLIRMSKEAAEKAPASLLAQMGQKDGFDGRTAFLAAKAGDAAGQAVVDSYIHYLACGLTNIINIFQPEIIGLSGGISKEGDNLLIPLREATYAHVYGGKGEKTARIEQCTLGHRAGVIGAAMLAKSTLGAP